MKPPESLSITESMWRTSTAHTEPLAYWEHELGPLSGALHAAEAEFLEELLARLKRVDEEWALAFYPASEELSQEVLGERASLRKTFRRGVFFKRETVNWVCGAVEPTARALELSWVSLLGNDTVLWCLGNPSQVTGFLEKHFLDDVESNPENEVALVRALGATVASRGWDGMSFRIYSVTWDEERFAPLVEQLAARRGWTVESAP